MPASVVDGFQVFLVQQLGVACYDGEIPRYSVTGEPISPANSTARQPVWPVIKVYTPEPGFSREPTFEDPYTDTGEVAVIVYGTSRQQLEGTLANPALGLVNRIEALFAQASNWPQVPLGGPAVNPYYVIDMRLTRWWTGREEGVGTAASAVLNGGERHE